MTIEDAAAIIAAACAGDPPFGLLLKFLLYTGARIGEAMALRWEDLAFEDGTPALARPRMAIHVLCVCAEISALS
jgi:integrase